jgi:hypothetical protein
VVDSKHLEGKAHLMVNEYFSMIEAKAIGGNADMPSRIAPADR